MKMQNITKKKKKPTLLRAINYSIMQQGYIKLMDIIKTEEKNFMWTIFYIYQINKVKPGI